MPLIIYKRIRGNDCMVDFGSGHILIKMILSEPFYIAFALIPFCKLLNTKSLTPRKMESLYAFVSQYWY